ncbi:MAG: hypothetical protein ACKVU4_08225 [Phycisphaerales bacterium]
MPTISTRDRELLAALDDPAGLDPVEYARWIERPEIQRVIAARDDLRAREEHAQLARFRDRILIEGTAALDTLKAVIACHRSCHEPCHRQAPSGDSLPSSSTSSKLVGADSQGAEPQSVPDARVLTEIRRAASSITRLARACLSPLPHRAAALRAHAGAAGVGADRPTREASAPLHRSSPPQQPQAPDSGSPSRSSPAAADLSVSPSRPPTPPASSIPGLHEAVAAFVRAARKHSTAPDAADKQSTLAEAAAHTAEHRKQDFGDNFPHWLESRCALVRDAEARPGVTLFQDDLDGAIQFVTLHRPTGSAQCLFHVVLERYPDGRNRWAIADVVTHDDHSTRPAHLARDDSS